MTLCWWFGQVNRRKLRITGWEINSTKVQGLSSSGKFLGIQWSGVCRDIPSKARDRSLYLAHPTIRKKCNIYWAYLDWKAVYSLHESVVSAYRTKRLRKILILSGVRKRRSVSIAQAALQAVLPLGPYDPTGSVVPKASVRKMLSGAFPSPS